MLINFIYKIHVEQFLLVACCLMFGIIIILIYSLKKQQCKWNCLKNAIINITKIINSVRYGDLSQKIQFYNFDFLEKLSESINRMVETLHDRESMISEYQNDLLSQNKFLENIINSLSDGLIITDTDGRILRTTQNVSEWFNTADRTIIGEHLTDFIQIPGKKSLPLLNNDEITVYASKDLNFIASTVELFIEEDGITRYIIIIKNITDQKELETLKEDFVATLTHDLKVPIIAETNMLELLVNENFGKISDKQKTALSNMQTSNKELLELVQTVLDTYKIKGGKINLYKENILLKGFINEIIEEMIPIANKTKNSLNFILERDIRVFADKLQLKRVIKNLIQNAISYGDAKSPIDISIGEIPGYVVIKVRDKGAGISKADIDKIFNRYYSAAKKFRKIGNGLGLYLALQITKAHGGDLTVESTEGEYTEFCIRIPVKYEQDFI